MGWLSRRQVEAELRLVSRRRPPGSSSPSPEQPRTAQERRGEAREAPALLCSFLGWKRRYRRVTLTAVGKGDDPVRRARLARERAAPAHDRAARLHDSAAEF